MAELVFNVVGEKDFNAKDPSAYNPWDQNSLRTKLEIWAHRNKINSADQVHNLLVHYFFGVLLTLPYTNSYSEIGTADIFYKKTGSAIKVVAFNAVTGSAPQVKAFILQLDVQGPHNPPHFEQCEITWIYNYIRERGNNAVRSKYFLKAFKSYYLLEFGRPKSLVEYEIFTSESIRQLFKSTPKSPLRVMVHKINVDTDRVNVAINGDIERCSFNILESSSKFDFEPAVSNFVHDRNHIGTIFEHLLDIYKQYKTKLKIAADVNSFLSFCHGALEYHMAKKYNLKLLRLNHDYVYADALYVISKKNYTVDKNLQSIVKVIAADRKTAPHTGIHEDESESSLSTLTPPHSIMKVIVNLDSLQQNVKPNPVLVQHLSSTSLSNKNFITKMMALSRRINSIDKDAKRYVASEIESLKILTQTEITNHSISFHLLGQLLGVQQKDESHLLKTYFKYKNPLINHFITTFTVKEAKSSVILVINILENDYGRGTLSPMFREVGASRPAIDDEMIKNILVINIRTSLNLFPLKIFDEEYLIFKEKTKFKKIMNGEHYHLPDFGLENLTDIFDKTQEEVLFVDKVNLFKDLKPTIKSSSDFSSVIQGILSPKLDFEVTQMDEKVVFKLFPTNAYNQNIILLPEWDIIDNVTDFTKCAMKAIRGIIHMLNDHRKSSNVTIISFVHQHLIYDPENSIFQVAKISNWNEKMKSLLNSCPVRNPNRQKRALSDCFYVRYNRPDDMISLRELGPTSGSTGSINSLQTTNLDEPQPGPSGLQRQPSQSSVDASGSRSGQPVTENVRQRMRNAYNQIVQRSVSQVTLVSTTTTSGNFLRFFPRDVVTAAKRAYQIYRDRTVKTLNALMYLRMGSNTVAGFINQDYAMAGINIGLLSTAALPYFTRSLMMKGETLLGAGRIFSGISRVGAAIAAPRVGIMGLMVYNLVDNIGQYKSGNDDALVGIIGDSVMLSLEATSIGLQIASKFLTSLRFFTSAINPIITIFTASLFIAIDIYMTVKYVEDMDAVIPLTHWEKRVLGVDTFLHITHKGLENLRRSKIHNMNAAQYAMEIFKQSNGSVAYMFRPRTYNNSRGEITFYEDNVLDLRINSTLISRVWPDTIAGLQVVAMDDEYANLYKDVGTQKTVYGCSHMIGFKNDEADPNVSQVIIYIDDGYDTVHGFQNADHTFVIGNGLKHVEGGNGVDNFVLTGDKWTNGKLNGFGGRNMVNMTNYASGKDIHINLTADYGFISNVEERQPDQGNSLLIYNIQEFIGRENAADKITCSCDTQTIHLKGGRSADNMDEIFFGQSCDYATKVFLTPPVLVVNSISTKGVFHYIVEDEVGLSEVRLPKDDTTTEHDFLFRIDILDIEEMSLDRSNGESVLTMSIEVDHDETGPKRLQLVIKNLNHNLLFVFNDFELMRIVGDTAYVNQTTSKTVDHILAHYPEAADRLGLSMRIHSIKSNAVVIIGHSKIDTKSETSSSVALANTLKNDPTYTSHLVGSSMKSVFMLMCIQNDTNDLPYTKPVVIHNYHLTPNVNNTFLVLSFDNEVAKITKTRPIFKLDVSGNDILINVIVNHNKTTKNLTHFVIKDALIDKHYEKLTIVRRRPMFIVPNEDGSFRLAPRPLEIDLSSVMITEMQIEPNTTIIINYAIGPYMFARSGENLVILNTLDMNSEDLLAVEVTLMGFYNIRDMWTLTISFKDREIVLAQYIDDINSAADFHFLFTNEEDDHEDYNQVRNVESDEYS